jgi:hypothetical protein
MPRFPSVLVDAHLALRDEMTPEQTLAYMRQRMVEGNEIAGEFVVRVLSELGDEKARELAQRTELAGWHLTIDEGRIEAEPTVGLARRRALTPIARDVERSLGRAPRRTSEATLRDILRDKLVPSTAPANAEQLADA